MQIGNPSSASIAASVWAFTGARQLTSSTAQAAAISSLASVGAGLILDIRPTGTKTREMMFLNTNNTSLSMGTYDGTTFTVSPATYSVPFYFNSMAAIGIAIKNVSAGAVNAVMSGIEWS